MDLKSCEKESDSEEEVAYSSTSGYAVQPIAEIPSYGRMGLRNTNNMCYMNSAIQV